MIEYHQSVIKNIYQHTRVALDGPVILSADCQPVVIGVLLGQRAFANHIQIIDSFELRLAPICQMILTHDLEQPCDPKIDIDHYEREIALVKRAKPNLDLIGWYSTSPENYQSKQDLSIHEEISKFIPDPIFLKIHFAHEAANCFEAGGVELKLFKLEYDSSSRRLAYKQFTEPLITKTDTGAGSSTNIMHHHHNNSQGPVASVEDNFKTPSPRTMPGVLGTSARQKQQQHQPSSARQQVVPEYRSVGLVRRIFEAFNGPNRSSKLPRFPLGMDASPAGGFQQLGSTEVQWHAYEQPGETSHNELGGAHMASSPHYCHPSHIPASSESDTSSESLMIDPNLILNPNVTMAIAKEGPSMMTVKLAELCHNNIEEDYKMTAKPRGPCLIVNNIDFENDIFPQRKGSDEDARRFDEIFQQLGFTVIMRRNQSADQMRELFVEVSNECKPEHDALFVFILSHGSERGIYGTDGCEVDLDTEILSCFDNRTCKAMIGKPKVFVIQACRGRARDCGGDGDAIDSIVASAQFASPAAVPTSVSQPSICQNPWLPRNNHGKKRKHPIHTDMLLVFSCLSGYVSVRNELAGSWLGVALAYFLMTQAHDRDLLRILNSVTSDIIQRESTSGYIQSVETKLLGWTKNLYFNPGFYS